MDSQNSTPQIPIEESTLQPSSRNFIPLVKIIGYISLLVIVGAGGYLVGRKQLSTFQSSQISPTTTTLTSTPSTVPTLLIKDDTNDWEIYFSADYNFQIKYPTSIFSKKETDIPNILLLTSNVKEFEDTGLRLIVFDPVPEESLEEYIEIINTDGRYRNKIATNIKGYPAYKIQYETPPGYPKKMYFIKTLFKKDDSVYSLMLTTLNNKSMDTKNQLFDRVLSTIEFLDNQTTTYTCPQNGWVNCMPILTEEAKKECSAEALAWYEANCPNFKGIAR